MLCILPKKHNYNKIQIIKFSLSKKIWLLEGPKALFFWGGGLLRGEKAQSWRRFLHFRENLRGWKFSITVFQLCSITGFRVENLPICGELREEKRGRRCNPIPPLSGWYLSGVSLVSLWYLPGGTVSGTAVRAPYRLLIGSLPAPYRLPTRSLPHSCLIGNLGERMSFQGGNSAV